MAEAREHKGTGAVQQGFDDFRRLRSSRACLPTAKASLLSLNGRRINSRSHDDTDRKAAFH
jgi:hypothetical protein